MGQLQQPDPTAAGNVGFLFTNRSKKGPASLILQAGLTPIFQAQTAGFGFQFLAADGTVILDIPETGYVPPGGGIGGGGTLNRVAKFTAATDVGDSLLSDDGTNVSLTSGQALAPNGTAALPSFSFSGDPNTGLYRSAADVASISGGGVAIANFDGANSRLSIPSGVVQRFLGNGTAGAPVIQSSAGAAGIYFSGTSILFAANSANALTLSSTGAIFAVPILFPDGSVGSPSITFTNDTLTGLYLPSSSQIGFSIGGTQTVLMTSSATQSSVPFRAPAGSAATPGIAFSSDPNTGLRNGGTDVLTFVAGANDLFDLDGINLKFSIPSSVSIQLVNAGTVGNPVIFYYFGSGTGIYFPSSSTVAIAANGTQGALVSATDFQVPGNIQTGNPSGGTAQTWRLGSVVAAASAFDNTRYVEAEINGVAVKLALVS